MDGQVSRGGGWLCTLCTASVEDTSFLPGCVLMEEAKLAFPTVWVLLLVGIADEARGEF